MIYGPSKIILTNKNQMAKSISSSRKTNFGKRKGGKAVKTYNKHHSKSTYHKQNAKRQK